jgi:pimeloyl-ACP methyl ester carboxylesterase
MASREINRTGIHEELLLDLAAAIKALKARGVERIILCGHSGGGSLMAFYQSQAETAPPGRITQTPAGDPPDLNKYNLPKADGIVTMNAAEGEGEHFTHHLDPSIVDENDPFSYDPSLDAFNPDNGFRVPPGVTKYTPEFLDRYRKAQQERGRRVAQMALARIRQQNGYRDSMKTPAYKQLPLNEQLMIERRAQFDPPMNIYRARSEPRYYDLSIDPSDREVGHMSSPVKDGFRRSDLKNWAFDDPLNTGIDARAFLSTLSILSNAKLYPNLKKVTVPILVTNSSADSGIYPSEGQKTFDAAVSKDKEKVFIIGAEHGYQPAGPKAGKGDQQEQIVDAIAAWATKRWPSAGTTIGR